MTADSFEPILDGKIPPPQDGVVYVLVPTQENVEALRDRGEYVHAFTLQRSVVAASAMELLRAKGVKIPTAELMARFHERHDVEETDRTYLERIVAEAQRRVDAGTLEPSNDVLQAMQILLHYRKLSNVLARLQANQELAELWAASVLSASSLGVAVGMLWGDEHAGQFKPAEEFKSLQQLGGEARAKQRTWWYEEGIRRCTEWVGANPKITRKALARRLQREFERHRTKAQPLPKHEGGYYNAIQGWEKAGLLKRPNGSEDQ